MIRAPVEIGADFPPDPGRIARPLQAERLLRPFDQAGGIVQQLLICGKEAAQPARSPLAFQRIAQPEQKPLGREKAIAPLQRARDRHRMPHGVNRDRLDPHPVEHGAPERHQQAEPRILDNEQAGTAEFLLQHFDRPVAKAVQGRRMKPVGTEFLPFMPTRAARVQDLLVEPANRSGFPIARAIPLISGQEVGRHVAAEQVERPSHCAGSGAMHGNDQHRCPRTRHLLPIARISSLRDLAAPSATCVSPSVTCRRHAVHHLVRPSAPDRPISDCNPADVNR